MTIVITSAARTPMGAFGGAFASLPASALGAAAIRAAVERAGLSPDAVDEVFFGNVLQAGQGQAPARQAAIKAGLPNTVPTSTTNKMCGSGLETIIQAARALQVGDARIAVAGGMESMTNAPYLLPGARSGLRLGNSTVVDSMVHDGLWDAYDDKHMGSCAELCATKYDFTREAQDAFAEQSYRRAQAAQKNGDFAAEIVPVEVTDRRGDVTVVDTDEGPGQANFARIGTLRPAFEKDGTITAANASTLNDGAAALVLTTDEVAHQADLTIRAKVMGWASNAHEPEWFTTAPVGAIQKLLSTLGWAAEDVDLWEINEAFSVVTMTAMEEFTIPAEQVNVNGGAVALGHPIGASGARIVVTLLHAMEARNVKRGVAAICIGGGEALALALERP